MKVALLHYHLKTGGVTSVLRQQAEILHSLCDVLIISGSAPASELPFPVAVIEAIGYDRPERAAPHPRQIARRIDEAIRSHFSGPCDLLHVHNPLLAKNKGLLGVLSELQDKDYPLLLQVHDFAEDGRPHLYYPEPYLSDCHYAVINSRDRQALLDAGANRDGVHLLPNMVAAPAPPVADRPSSDLILYPIRAIRRKNIGEAILLSLFFEPAEKLAITLPPNSPADFPSYEGWKQLAAKTELNIEFEAGLHTDFPALVQSCRSLVTTSIMEGFGFAFLEPWLAGKLLWGRKLPQICSDFEQNGVRLPHLYTTLKVPLQWIEHENFEDQWKACAMEASKRFNFSVSGESLQTAFDRMTAGGAIDFGLLGEYYQKQVIRHIVGEPADRSQLVAINPWLSAPAEVTDAADLIAANGQAVQQHYSQDVYRQTLMEIYRTVAEEKVQHRIDKQKLLAAFFQLDNFSLLKWGPYVE